MDKAPHPDRGCTSSLDFWLARAAIACVADMRLLVDNDLSLLTMALVAARAVNILA